MELKEILAISKLPGLFQIVASRDNGLIVSPLGEDKRKFVASRQHMFTPLENITVYTNTDSIELTKIFESIKLNLAKHPLPDPKADDKVLRAYFTEIVPDHDQQRVYISDIKKMLKWYVALDANGLLNIEKEGDKADKKETKEAKEKSSVKKVTKAGNTAANSKSTPKTAAKPVAKKAPKSVKK
ncbi:MAG: DUF5606 domain-containing protein [Chitinophagales bacterium]